MTAGADPGRPSWPRAFAVVVLVALAWLLRDVLMLAFGAVLVAATLRALAEPLAGVTGMARRHAVLVVVAVLVVLGAVGAWAIGDRLASQLEGLRQALPEAWRALRGWLQRSAAGERLLESIDGADLLQWSGVAHVARGTLKALGAAVLIVLAGVYFALDVTQYRAGALRLVPPRHRASVAQAVDEAGHALTRWLLGQAVAMVVVGVAVAIGLTLLDVPLALALGLIAGVLEFVPFLGPIVAGALSVLVAFMQGPALAVWVAALFLAVQQVENHVLVPLVQRWAVQLPPALALLAVVAFGTLVGPLGVLFALPLLVVVMVFVRRLVVERALEGQGP